MKTKLVLWGSNAAGERVLIASALNAKENQVSSWIFPLEVSTEEFYNLLINAWRFGEEVTFPEPHETYIAPLSVTEGFFPEGIEVERSDLLSRAHAEWHFVVLSSKLYRSYLDEILELKERIEELEAFDLALWERLKGFWGRVQSQIHEKTLFHEHARKLRNQTNAMFTSMKELRRKMDHELKELSSRNKHEFLNTLAEIEERIEKGLGLKPLFEDLKQLQQRFRKTKFISSDRTEIWKKIDETFKTIKEKRFGPESKKERSAADRIKRRYEGLLAAIQKMEKSIAYDKKDIVFQGRKIEQSEGQLEEQIRQAKLKMIEERIKSKENKLQEMTNTRTELEKRLAREEQKAEERKKQEEIDKAREEAKEQIKGKIAEEIKHAAEEREPEADKLVKAAEALKETKSKDKASKKEPLLAAIGTTLGESLKDVADTIRAVAEVVDQRLEEEFMREEDDDEMGQSEEE